MKASNLPGAPCLGRHYHAAIFIFIYRIIGICVYICIYADIYVYRDMARLPQAGRIGILLSNFNMCPHVSRDDGVGLGACVSSLYVGMHMYREMVGLA